ncbi:Gfo/Idh/MocA family protein [Actinoplanes couchii]|uniref:Oxidoreductase n=1 Tax=Actinoplanes couchii TaxID=403638 RepID=A0ABQ3XMS3_9ACTN|nr:Gfo/Idh/MocA family oxidoreductase [Actinoplanes couchii]MDR6317776.1 putative dehydrogenase [Actinoplanes couchii]GID59765.1 oxidoreductase [Actinoplanes couchii]
MKRFTRRAAIIGTGAIAAAHAEALRAHGDRVQTVAVHDLALDRAEAFAEAWRIPSVHASIDELLANEIDLVHLCTPPSTHLPIALRCLEAGVTVLVEKPPTLSLAELDRLAEAAAKSGAYLATVFQHRFGSGAAHLRGLVDAGTLGPSLLATCHTLWYRDDAYFQVPWRGKWETEGGGPTMGHGIHQFDLLLSVLGDWERVTAIAARRSRPVQTEDVSMALVEFADGTVASVVNSVVSARQTSSLRFDFEKATIELDHLYGYSDADWTVTPAPGSPDVTWPAGTSKSGHHDQIGLLLDALDAGIEPPVSVGDTRRTMEFIAALYASAATGQQVRRGDIKDGHPFYGSMNGNRWTFG